MHELLGQEFAHAGAEHGPAIGATAVGGRSAPLQLHFPALALKNAFNDRHRTAVAVAIARAEGTLLDVFGAVDRQGIAGGPSPGVHRFGCDRGIARKQSGEVAVAGEVITEPKFGEQTETVGDIFRFWNGCWPHGHPVA